MIRLLKGTQHRMMLEASTQKTSKVCAFFFIGPIDWNPVILESTEMHERESHSPENQDSDSKPGNMLTKTAPAVDLDLHRVNKLYFLHFLKVNDATVHSTRAVVRNVRLKKQRCLKKL